MTIELRPLGVACNLQCHYCYQNPQRDADGRLPHYDIEKMKEAAAREGQPFSVFGGEPLLVPVKDLESLWAFGFERFGRNSLQTNGTLITDRHVELFRTYNVGVGISVDGPGECNDARWMGTLERTRTATTTTLAAIDRLLAEGIRLSLIVTVHRCNASADRLPQMAVWFKELEKKGLKAARLHILESESAHIRERYGLSPAANLRAFRHFMALERGELTTLRFDVFAEMESLLLGEDESASCVWRACDPYTTRAVQGIEGTGQRSNCGRTNKDGIDFVKSRAEGFERYAALHETSYEDGGCSGCRFFLMCKGQCPGTALDGDWRNRTEHCAVWMGLFEDLERRLIAEGKEPLSRRADRAEIESRMVHAWVSGRNMSLKAVATAPVDAP